MSRKLLAFGISVSAVVLLVLGSLTNVVGYQIVKQTTEHEVTNNSQTERISVAIIGNKNIQRIVALSRQQVLLLQNELNSLQARINNARSEAQVLQIYKKVTSTLGEMNLLPQGVTTRRVSQYLVDPTKNQPSKRFQEPKDGPIINACCLFAARTQWTDDSNFWTFIARNLNQIAYRLHSNFLWNLSLRLCQYGETKPLRFLNEIDVGIGGVYWYFTLGLKGLHIGNYDFGSAFGFSGLKIFVSHVGYTDSYYFGSAFLVTSIY